MSKVIKKRISTGEYGACSVVPLNDFGRPSSGGAGSGGGREQNGGAVVAVQAGSGGVFKADGRCQGAPTGH